jgi:hypothetical protein
MSLFKETIYHKVPGIARLFSGFPDFFHLILTINEINGKNDA